MFTSNTSHISDIDHFKFTASDIVLVSDGVFHNVKAHCIGGFPLSFSLRCISNIKQLTIH